MNDLTTHTGDCLEILRAMPAGSVALTVTSPPYEDKRTYGMGYALTGDAWVQFCADRFIECVRVTNGPVFWVVGHGSSGVVQPWSAAPALLIAELHRRGVHLLRPVYYKRRGVMGAGGRQWFAPLVEWVIAATGCPKGRLPCARVADMLGRPPKCPPGGAPSHRTRDGRVNKPRPLERRQNGERKIRMYKPPRHANPGDIIDCGTVGGKNMGSEIAHTNEAPFPEALVAPFIKAFTNEGDTVLDPFSGSGTTAAVAVRMGRKAVAIDERENQIRITRKRVLIERVGQEMQGGVK